MKILFFTTVIAVVIIVSYVFLFDPHHVRLKTVTIHNKVMASALKGLKIVHLSDLHIGNKWSPAVRQTLAIINRVNPDLILLTGDYVEWHGKEAAYDKTFDFLSHLNASLGVYAVMGDADYSFSRKSCNFCHQNGSALPPIQHKVKFLRDKKIIVKIAGKEISIIGMEYNSKPNIIDKLLTDIPTILLSHTSLIYKNINPDMNVLILAGDTHGGQIYLPQFIWKILRRKIDPEHMYGLYQNRNKSLYVTSGVGTSGIPFRLGVSPEVVLFEFKE